MGYLLASARVSAVALHDCDVTNYQRGMLARLLYPVANPHFDYHFCKGYYARVADGRMHGRVSRLLVSPLLRALRRLCGPCELLETLDGFRYPLSGECALALDVLRDIRVPGDWGLEIGLISEVWSKHPAREICQAEIADHYDHKHQDLSPGDATRGLSKMSVDIARSLFKRLAAQGHVFGDGFFQTLQAAYSHMANELIQAYQDDARMNGLQYDRQAEQAAVELFARNLLVAAGQFQDDPLEHAFMPAWERVVRELPGILDELLFAVEQDMAEAGGEIHRKAGKKEGRMADYKKRWPIDDC
jgi:glucosyl-3-phosphoglycerate synthase